MIVLFWNGGRWWSAEALDRLAKNADVIVCAEVGDQVPLLAGWAAARGWYYHAGDGSPGSSRIAFLARSRSLVRYFETTVAHERLNVGDWGAGPEHVGPKVLNEVWLSDGLVVVGTHLIASWSRRRPHGKAFRRSWRARRNAGRLHVAALVARVTELREAGHPVLVLGDFNARPGFRLLRPLRKLMRQHVRYPTFKDGRTLDHAYTTDGVVVNACTVMTMPGRDHDALHLDVGTPVLVAHPWEPKA